MLRPVVASNTGFFMQLRQRVLQNYLLVNQADRGLLKK